MSGGSSSVSNTGSGGGSGGDSNNISLLQGAIADLVSGILVYLHAG